MNLPELTWVEPVEIQIPSEFAQSLTEHPVVLNALVRRGITQLDQARAYMDPSFYHLADPLEIPGMDLAVSRIQTALESREKIAIWGDFDVDGQTSTSLLAQTFKLLGANFQQYIPVRARESHGVNTSGLDRLIKAGASLILTCDTGITAHAEVDYAHLHGVDLIITDHHTLPASLPDAKAVVNPQRLPPEHPLRPLCGVGVAYQLAKELFKRSGKENEAGYLLDLVALGTVADLASLTGDNRSLVQSGLQVLRNSPRPAFKALLSLADVNPAQLNEEHLGFVIAPRLNALGRLGDANPIVPFLLSTEGTTVLSLAQELETLNSRRKLLCDQVFQAALARLQRDRAFLDDAVLVLDHANWPAGVIGIVASRLVDLYKRPVILISADPGGVGRASARSIEGINITQALEVNQDLLVNYGGHAMAAGFSLLTEHIPKFRGALNRTIRQMTAEKPPIFELSIDAYIALGQITMELVESIDHLAPFGSGNPPIILASRGLVIKSHTTIGKTKEHLQVIVEDVSTAAQKVLWWQGAGSPLPEGSFDLAYSVRASNFRGQHSLQLEWIAFRQVNSTIEIRPPSKFEIIDFRQCLDPLNRLPEFASKPLTLIWGEGEINAPVSIIDRYHLFQAQSLVLWNIPPGRDELRAILQVVKPKQVVIFGINSAPEKPQVFLNRLIGLIRFIIRAYQGKTSLKVLAAATSQRETTIKKGLAWLVASGFIKIEAIDENIILVQSDKHTPDILSVKQIESEINHLLTETGAYRAYFSRADAKNLLED